MINLFYGKCKRRTMKGEISRGNIYPYIKINSKTIKVYIKEKRNWINFIIPQSGVNYTKNDLIFNAHFEPTIYRHETFANKKELNSFINEI